MKGITIIEILLVIGISGVLIYLTLPMGIDFYNYQQLNTSVKGVIQALRTAQLKAISQEADSSYGVYLTNDNYTLFKGDLYSTRDQSQDEVFDLPIIVDVGGLNAVVFSKLEGRPNPPGNIELKSGETTAIININEMGTINQY